MDQTEMVLRLLKDGKIVGYEQHTIESKYGFVITLWSDDLSKDNLLWSSVTLISCDSFEQGIRVGDEWWFHGDKIRITASEKGKFTGVLHYGQGVWEICGDGMGLFLYDVILGYADAKRIGNIHEEKP